MANQLSRAAYNQQRAIQRGLLGRGEIPDTSLLGRFAEDARTPGAASGFAKGLLSGAVGLPADVLSLMNMPLAASPYNAGAQKLQGLLQPFTSDGIAEKLGADPNRMTTQAGLIGAPDPGDIGKVAMRAGQDGLLGAMTLFHGTPHKFDNFDLKAIGTGEGAQAYGHGLYFAENPGVAKSYQSTLAPLAFPDGDNRNSIVRLIEAKGDEGEKQVRQILSSQKIGNNPIPSPAELDQMVADAKEAIASPGRRGHLYEVDIPDDTIDLMLDWDAPLSEQPESVRAALSDLPAVRAINDELQNAATGDLGPDVWQTLSGENLYRSLGSQSLASDTLNEAGIPGIRYFDGGSRGTGEGTRNIVVFNPEDIREVKRDGEIVARQGLLDSPVDDYKGLHTAPLREGRNTLDDAVDIYGDDIYDPSVSWRYYGHGGDAERMDKGTARIIAGFRGKPDADVTIYRAVPDGVTDINAGDWVTVNKEYAKEHGYRHIGDDYKIVERKVKAKDIATDGNSIHEWGYDPQSN